MFWILDFFNLPQHIFYNQINIYNHVYLCYAKGTCEGGSCMFICNDGKLFMVNIHQSQLWFTLYNRNGLGISKRHIMKMIVIWNFLLDDSHDVSLEMRLSEKNPIFVDIRSQLWQILFELRHTSTTETVYSIQFMAFPKILTAQ